MSNYYAVDRNSEYLAHYGIKGMKWGVRRALARGDRAALRKQYRKAAIKLGKLSVQANRGMMQKRYAAAKNNMATGAISSAGLSAMGTMLANPRLDNASKAKISALAGLAGGAAGALLNSRGIMSGRYISDKGHTKAIAKRDAFRKEMETTFKDTGVAPSMKEMRRFHNQITAISDQKDPKAYTKKQAAKARREATAHTKPNKRRNNTNVKKELGYALKSAALSTVMGPAANMYVNSRRAANNDWPEKSKKKPRRS